MITVKVQKEMISRLVWGVLLLELVNCKPIHEEPREIEVISVEHAIENPGTLQVSDCFRSIRYVPLETTDSCLIGRDPSVSILNDYIVVTYGREKCYLFDKQSGRFIRSVGHIGQDGEGAAYIDATWGNPYTEQFYFPKQQNKRVLYGTDGRFKGVWNAPIYSDGLPAMEAFDYLDQHISVACYFETDTDPMRLVFFQDSQIVRMDTLPKGSKGEPLFAPENIKTYMGWGNIVIYGFGEDRSHIRVRGKCFWHQDEDTYFKTTYNDTIYRLSVTDGLVPVKRLDFGKYGCSYTERYTQKPNMVCVNHLMENRHLLFFSFMSNLFPEKRERPVSYNAVYNKGTKTVVVSPSKELITDDKYGFLPFQPQSVSKEGEFVGLLQAGDVVEWFEQKGEESLPEEIAVLKQVKEEDNPVVVIME